MTSYTQLSGTIWDSKLDKSALPKLFKIHAKFNLRWELSIVKSHPIWSHI